jgi:hypothetical protein
MPLPPPPGYSPKRQQRIDKRRIALAGALFAGMSAVLVVLAQRVARTPGEPLPVWPLPYVVLVIAGAGFCGAWNEAMCQIAFIRRGSPGAPLWRFRRR